MTKEEQEMISRALDAHAARIEDVARTTGEAIRIGRENQVAMARVEGKIEPLEKGISEIKESVKEITKALAKENMAHEVKALKSDFHDCRSQARKRLWWVLGIIATVLGGAGATGLVYLIGH